MAGKSEKNIRLPRGIPFPSAKLQPPQSSDQFNAQRDLHHTSEQHKDFRHPFGIRISAYGQLAFVNTVALQEIGKQCGEREDTYPASLDEQHDDELSPERKMGCRIDHDQSRDTNRACGGERGVNP